MRLQRLLSFASRHIADTDTPRLMNIESAVIDSHIDLMAE